MATAEVLDEATANWSQQFWAQIEVSTTKAWHCNTADRLTSVRIRKLAILSISIQSAVNADGHFKLGHSCEFSSTMSCKFKD